MNQTIFFNDYTFLRIFSNPDKIQRIFNLPVIIELVSVFVYSWLVSNEECHFQNTANMPRTSLYLTLERKQRRRQFYELFLDTGVLAIWFQL